MFKKSAPRALPSVYRVSDEANNSNSQWYDLFIENLEKSSNQARSIYDDISAILGNSKSKYSSVEEAVQDMQERTGLKAFLEIKQASTQEPAVFSKIPEMKVFIDNFIKSHPGTSIESVVHDLLNIDSIRDKLPNKADVDDEVKAYINKQIFNVLKDKDTNEVSMQIGKVDQNFEESGNDPFAICEPTNS